MTIGEILAYKDDEDDSDLLATIGMLRSDLVEILANIRVAVDGLEEVIANNTNLTDRDVSLIQVAVVNYEDLYDVLTLGIEIPQREVDRVVRSIHAKTKLLHQMESSQFKLSDVVEKESRAEACSKKPSQMVKNIFEDEHI